MSHRPQHSPPGQNKAERAQRLKKNARRPRIKDPAKEARKAQKRARLPIRKEGEYYRAGEFHICRFCASPRAIQRKVRVPQTDAHGVPLVDADGNVAMIDRLVPLANFAHLEIQLEGGGKFTLNGCYDCLRAVQANDEDGDILEILMEEDSEGVLYIENDQDFVPNGKIQLKNLTEILRRN